MTCTNLTENCGPGKIPIQAGFPRNPTGINIIAGKKYRFTAEGCWCDKKFLVTADGYEKWYLFPWRFLRDYKSAPWFCLIGQVNDELIRMGTEGNFTAKTSGELFCFANDAKKMRKNNSGCVCLEVKEME